MATTVKRALATHGTSALYEMIKNCMAQDLSWKVTKRTILPIKHNDPANKFLQFECFRGAGTC